MTTELDRRQVAMAEVLARIAHGHQTYGAVSYAEGHLKRVVDRLADAGRDGHYLAVAWLHDVIEDTGITEAGLRAGPFERLVVDWAVALARRDDEAYDDYITRLCGEGPVVLRVKQADLETNIAANPPGSSHAHLVEERWAPALVRILQAIG